MKGVLDVPLLERRVIHRGYDRRTCWVHARCGFIPPGGDGQGTIVVTLQKCLMGTSDKVWDLFEGIWMMRSGDGGATWWPPEEQTAFRRWREPGGIEVAVSDFTPQWHAASGTLLGLGHTCRYRGGALMEPPRPRETAWSVFDTGRHCWGPVGLLAMPCSERFHSAGAGSIQWVERPDGDLLVPIYFREREVRTLAGPSKVIVLRCRFDGEALSLVEMGNELSVAAYRGLGEPSLIELAGQYWMTLRNGERAYLSHSADGLHFSTPQPWLFDDGGEIGSYDTQQHWARAGERLFLVYTRRGGDNAHVVRHRAPLYIAEFDPARRVLLRETEQVAVPNRGGQLGNFGVSQRNEGEAWICVSEWMENAGEWNPEVWNALKTKYPQADLKRLAAMPGRCGLCELSGADNSVHLVRVTL